MLFHMRRLESFSIAITSCSTTADLKFLCGIGKYLLSLVGHKVRQSIPGSEWTAHILS